MRPLSSALALVLAFPLAAPAARAQTAPAAPAAPPASAGIPAMEAVDFDEAVRRATERSPTAQLAAQEVRRVEGLLWQVRSGSLPLLTASATYTRIDGERTTRALVPSGAPVSTAPPVFDQVTSKTVRTAPESQNNQNLTLSAPLFAPSRWYQWAHASDQVDVTRASQRDVRRLVALNAARAYLTIISQKRAIEVSRRAVQTAAAHYDYAHTRRQGGVGNALDEARADQQLATAQAQLEGALAGLTRAQEALGIATGTDGPLDARAEPDLTGGPPGADEGVKAAEESRTDVLLSRQRLSAAHRVARDGWADWLPTLSLNGQLYRQSPATSQLPDHGWQLQLVASLPLFEGGLRVGQARERGALEAEARSQLDATLLQARADVRTAYANLQHATASLDQNRRAAQQANAALGIVQAAFKAGATTSLDVTDAERTARDADSAAVIAEDAVRQSRLDLLAATGRFPAP
jgi:outer membrane protein TolC